MGPSASYNFFYRGPVVSWGWPQFIQGGLRFEEWERVRQAGHRNDCNIRLGHVPRVIIKFMDFENRILIATTVRNGCFRDAGSLTSLAVSIEETAP